MVAVLAAACGPPPPTEPHPAMPASVARCIDTPYSSPANPRLREPARTVPLADLLPKRGAATSDPPRIDLGDVDAPPLRIVTRHGLPRVTPEVSYRQIPDELVVLDGPDAAGWRRWRIARKQLNEARRRLAELNGLIADGSQNDCHPVIVARIEDSLPPLDATVEDARASFVAELGGRERTKLDAEQRFALAIALTDTTTNDRALPIVMPAMELLGAVADDAGARRELRARSLERMAHLMLDVEEHGRAGEVLERLYTFTEEPRAKAEAAYRLGALALDPKRALDWHTKALETARGFDDPVIGALAAHEIARIEVDADRPAEALEAAATSALLAEKSTLEPGSRDPILLSDQVASVLAVSSAVDASVVVPTRFAAAVSSDLIRESQRLRDWDGAERAARAYMELDPKFAPHTRPELERIAESRASAAANPRAELSERVATLLEACREDGHATHPISLRVDTTTVTVRAIPEKVRGRRDVADQAPQVAACLERKGPPLFRSAPAAIVEARIIRKRGF